MTKEGATFEIIAPKVGGAKASDGSWIEADQMIDGGPSVLYDAVALLPAEGAMDDLLQESTARDFVADAFAHCKFIGYVKAAAPLFAKAGIAEADIDEGFISLASAKDVAGFVGKLGQLRVWGREPASNTAVPRHARTSSDTAWERLLRRSNMVNATPRIDSSGLKATANPLDRLEQLAEALERKELALQRHEQVAGGDQRIHRQQAQ